MEDIKPYKGIQLAYMRNIEPRRLELAEHMGILTKIEVKDGTDTTTDVRGHVYEPSTFSKRCVCVDCYGDFSGATEGDR